MIARICLATGSRWSEAEGLRAPQVSNGQIHFTGTKSGKNRSVPINDELVAELDEHLSLRYGDERSTDIRYFQYANSAFREAVKRAGLILPKGQSTHVLRHTFSQPFP
ncbi:MAG: tyrosine-type recombinase/integrase [Gammaproteobacteria bacterium]